jgi:hypothetical protein
VRLRGRLLPVARTGMVRGGAGPLGPSREHPCRRPEVIVDQAMSTHTLARAAAVVLLVAAATQSTSACADGLGVNGVPVLGDTAVSHLLDDLPILSGRGSGGNLL